MYDIRDDERNPSDPEEKGTPRLKNKPHRVTPRISNPEDKRGRGNRITIHLDEKTLCHRL